MLRFTLAFVLILSTTFLISCEDQVVAPQASSPDDAAVSSEVSSTMVSKGSTVLNFAARLSGDQEVPSVETGATGVARFTLGKDAARLHYKLNVANIEDVVASHIHCAPDGVNGPVGITLFSGGPVSVNGTLAEGVITEPDAENACDWTSFEEAADALQSGDTYVNVHTLSNPSGEIRGQITRGNGLRQPPSADEATLSQQLNLIREVTGKYRDVETARADGYVPVSPYVPGMGFHFANTVPPFGTDLDNPPVLVYYTDGSYNPAPGESLDESRESSLILGAVEYIVPGDQTDSPPNIFADEESHRRLKVTEEHGWHFESAEGFTGLHAWIHRGNPAGVFHHTNPNIN